MLQQFIIHRILDIIRHRGRGVGNQRGAASDWLLESMHSENHVSGLFLLGVCFELNQTIWVVFFEVVFEVRGSVHL